MFSLRMNYFSSVIIQIDNSVPLVVDLKKKTVKKLNTGCIPEQNWQILIKTAIMSKIFPLGIRYDKISTISVDDELFKSYFYLIYLLLNKRQKSLDLSLFKSFNSNCGYKWNCVDISIANTILSTVGC